MGIEALLAAGEEEAKAADLGLLGDGTATTTLLVLLKLEPTDSDSGLARPLWHRCLEPQLTAAVTSRCAFLLLALLKHEGTVRESLLSVLRKRRKEPESATQAAEASGTTVAGARKLL